VFAQANRVDQDAWGGLSMVGGEALVQCVDMLPLDASAVVEFVSGPSLVRERYLSRNPGATYREVDPARINSPTRDCTQDFCGADSYLIADPPDPERLAQLLTFLCPLGKSVCLLAVDNAAHYAQVKKLLGGGGEEGLKPVAMTLEQIQPIISDAGWRVDLIIPVIDTADDSGTPVKALMAAAESLGLDISSTRQRLIVRQWLIRCTNYIIPRQTVAALTMRKVAGVNEARVDHPLLALKSLPGNNLIWGSKIDRLPASWPPGVFIFHRVFLNNPQLVEKMEIMISRGWTFVYDIDDDPRHWQGFRDDDFFAFRGVHAVTVSTEALAAVIRPWNPNVYVLHNAIFELPVFKRQVPKDGRTLKIFFGALNRTADWAVIQDAVVGALARVKKSVELIVVHDRAVFDGIPDNIAKSFCPTLNLNQYNLLLSGCDIALLPLEDNQFNRLKSDLKFIECCAAGVVPICSPVVYSGRREHLAIGCFAQSPEDWADHLVRLCDDPAELQERRARGLAYVVSARMHAHSVSVRKQLYESLISQQDELEMQRQARLGRRLKGGYPAALT
jgi:hypothetical protein